MSKKYKRTEEFYKILETISDDAVFSADDFMKINPELMANLECLVNSPKNSCTNFLNKEFSEGKLFKLVSGKRIVYSKSPIDPKHFGDLIPVKKTLEDKINMLLDHFKIEY